MKYFDIFYLNIYYVKHTRVYDSVFIRKNKGQRNPYFSVSGMLYVVMFKALVSPLWLWFFQYASESTRNVSWSRRYFKTFVQTISINADVNHIPKCLNPFCSLSYQLLNISSKVRHKNTRLVSRMCWKSTLDLVLFSWFWIPLRFQTTDTVRVAYLKVLKGNTFFL